MASCRGGRDTTYRILNQFRVGVDDAIMPLKEANCHTHARTYTHAHTLHTAQSGKDTFKLDGIDFGRRMAVERELHKVHGATWNYRAKEAIWSIWGYMGYMG